MATTFHVTNFKNKTLDMLTGVSSSVTPIGFVGFFNGAQPADPSGTPAGASEFAGVSSGPNLSTKIGSAGQGIAQLGVPVSPASPSLALGVAGITFARLYTTGQAPIVDTPASLVGGGGGVICDSLTSVAGVGTTVTAFGFKMPSSLGTILLSASLANRLVDLWGGGSSTTANMGNTTGGSGTLNLYTGAAPATADAAPTGTLVATFNMVGTNLWAAASGGSAALNGAGPSVTANGSGTAAYFRFVKTNGLFTFTMQGSVGLAAADLIVSAVALTSGVTACQITDFTVAI